MSCSSRSRPIEVRAPLRGRGARVVRAVAVRRSAVTFTFRPLLALALRAPPARELKNCIPPSLTKRLVDNVIVCRQLGYARVIGSEVRPRRIGGRARVGPRRTG